ncbi:MAG: hypothetical protein HC834_00905 [Rhodospirillales bacterium]|nr:hypothetical protein [Rhodospirillales bacterium]
MPSPTTAAIGVAGDALLATTDVRAVPMRRQPGQLDGAQGMQRQGSAVVPAAVRARIDAEIAAMEQEEGVRILIAVESGSRARGFASPDSDWDIRFDYVRPIEWYLAIDHRPDVIERPIEDGLDFAGWDLRKALHLLANPNPALLEWLSSPVVCRKDAAFVPALRRLAEATDYRCGAWHHCQHLLNGPYRRSIADRNDVVLKEVPLLHPSGRGAGLARAAAIRPSANGTAGPARRHRSAERGPGAIGDLTVRKSAGRDVGTGPRIAVLDSFLEPLMTAPMPSSEVPLPDRTALIRNLNALFCRVVLSPGKGAHNEATARGLV